MDGPLLRLDFSGGKIKRTCSVIIRSPEGVEGKKSPTRLYDPQFNF